MLVNLPAVTGQHMDEEVSGDHGEYRNLDELVGQGSSREVTGISTGKKTLALLS